MSGFEIDLREKILGSNAHIQITREDGDFTEWREVKARIDEMPGRRRVDAVRGQRGRDRREQQRR